MAIVLNEKQTALAFGSFAAVTHIAWSVFVAAGLAQGFLNWLFGLHFTNNPHTIGTFNAVTAVMLIVVAFVAWAIMGFVFAKVWNWAGKQKYF